MPNRIIPLIILCLIVGTSAQAQSGGGGGGHRHGGGRGAPPSSDSAPAKPANTTPTPRAKPTNEIDIIGVVKSLGPEPDRVTIAYDAVDALGWPAGTTPFVVFRTTMLKDVTAGEKVRFRIDSLEISELKPFCADRGAAPGGSSPSPECPHTEPVAAR